MSEFQSRKYLLTIQNPTEKGYSHDIIKDILHALNVTYYCLSDEIASTGTLHTHCFIYRRSGIRERTIRKHFPSVHFDNCYGTCRENRDYVLKSGKWAETDKAETKIKGSFEEFGSMPDEKQEKNPDASDLIEQLEAGQSTAEIIKSNAKFVFRSNDINILRETILSEKYLKEEREVEVIYLYGATGTGKTRSIFDSNEISDICRITNYGNSANAVKFDAYHGQGVLVFEEFHGQISIFDMLNYLDRYPVILPARYTDRVCCCHKIYITSNIPLEAQYPSIQYEKPEVWKAFLRRITKVVEFTEDGSTEIIGWKPI